MIQPFVPFKEEHLKQLLKLGNVYIVSQTYKRTDHFMDQGKTFLLFTDYKDFGLAKIHHNAVREDKYAAIINLSKEIHLNKVNEMLANFNYDLYWNVVKSIADLRKRLSTSYKTKIRRYLINNTSWRITVDEEVKVDFEIIFGELYLVVRWRTKKLRIKFEQIERF